MRRGLRALIALVSLFCALPAFAAETPRINEQEVRSYFGAMAGQFGCAKLVDSQITTLNLGELSYVPMDETASRWTQLFTVTVQMLPEDQTLMLAATHSYTSSMMQGLIQHARIEKSTLGKAQDDTSVIYIEYEKNRGPVRVHGVGVYGRHTDSMAAYTRYEVRGRHLRDDEIAVMKAMEATLLAR